MQVEVLLRARAAERFSWPNSAIRRKLRHLSTIVQVPRSPLGLGSFSRPQFIVPGDEICILDDDPSIRRSLKELLESDDFEAETFDDPDKFLEYVRIHTVKLAVLDVWMPRQTGIQLQEQLDHLSPESRVIVITGREEPAVRGLVLANGAFAFFSKPIDSEAFLASVRAVLTV